MMKVSMITHGITLALLATAMPAAHAAGAWTEARNNAMGGTGVASSGYAAAALVDPALMTRHDASDDIGIILPGIGAQVSDPDNLQDGLDRVKDNWNHLSNAAGSGNSSGQAAALKKNLQDVSGNSGRASAGVSAVVAISNDTLPFALVVNGWGQAKARAVVTDHDLAWLNAAQSGIFSPSRDDLN